MKQLVFDINEMSDSKEIYSQRPSPIFAIFIYTILGLLVIALLYSCFGKIEIVVSSAGVIRPNEDVGTVSSLRAGKVTQVNYYDGQIVCKGDVLLTVDSKDLQIQLDSLQNAKRDYEKQILMIEKFLTGVETGENPFSANSADEEYPYYIQFEDYLLQLKNAQQSFDSDAQRAKSTVNALSNQVKAIEAQIAGWESYKKSVQQGTNLAGNYPEYESMYFLYTANMEALYRDYESQKSQLKASIPDDQLDEKLSELENSYRTAKEHEYYQTIVQIDSTIQSLRAELRSAKASLKQNQIANESYKNNTSDNGEALSVSIAVLEQTSALLSQQDSVQAKLDQVEVQILQTQEQVEQGTVTAQCDGTIRTVQTIVAGDIISSGTVIATIIPTNENVYKVQLYVNNADIADIAIGDTVKYNIAALPSNQYGTANGTVINVSADTLIQEGQYSGFYLVECTLQTNTLQDGDGNVGSISTGMQVEAKIITQEKTILRYLLEKINIFW